MSLRTLQQKRPTPLAEIIQIEYGSSVMTKGRLEAFSDGVIAIIITIMVLELKVPKEYDLAALKALAPTFLSYALSFVYVAIYWNNHHNLLHLIKEVKPSIMWANMNLLFWLSLFPFTTAWAGQSGARGLPLALYGLDLLFAAASYFIVQRTIITAYPREAPELEPLRKDVKGKLSLVGYLLGLALTYFYPPAAYVPYVIVALMWLVPDRRVHAVIAP